MASVVSLDGEAAMGLLRHELRCTAGPVPFGGDVDSRGFVATPDGFVLTISPELRFRYRHGVGVRYAASGDIGTAAVATFHEGSVHGAVAWMHGLVPLHASAVVVHGRVHAFAGPSGEGKSTLIAALGARGLRRFADDIVTLLVPAIGPPLALPGHKRLKLWADALALTGQVGTDRVWPGVDKFYIEDADGPPLSAMPLASLTLLESGASGSRMEITAIRGAACLTALRDNCYRPELRAPDRAAPFFAQLTRLAAKVPLFRFSRPRDLACFDDGVEYARSHIESLAA